jgi:hypothetical protein
MNHKAELDARAMLIKIQGLKISNVGMRELIKANVPPSAERDTLEAELDKNWQDLERIEKDIKRILPPN